MDQGATWHEVGLGPGHIVSDGDPPPRKAAQQPHLSVHVYFGQTLARLSNCWAMVQLYKSKCENYIRKFSAQQTSDVIYQSSARVFCAKYFVVSEKKYSLSRRTSLGCSAFLTGDKTVVFTWVIVLSKHAENYLIKFVKLVQTNLESHYRQLCI